MGSVQVQETVNKTVKSAIQEDDRSKNLIIFGLVETEKEQTDSKVVELLDAVYCRQLVSEILYNKPDSRVIEIFGFVDNMQLFDQISSTKQCSDKRIRLDVAEIQETVTKEVSTISWTATADMLADCLTKRGADFSELAKVVEEGFCDAITKC
ncbi:hypothetical protein ACHWQZ_G007587 [Mnemiopsis leidyi]